MTEEAGRLRVLVVEDESILALEIADLIERNGHEVIGVAADATRALSLAERHRPHLALVDCYLVDGLTGPQIGRALLRQHKVPVLFLTANPEHVPDDLEDALGILLKPFAERAFVGALTYALARLSGRTDLDLPQDLITVRRPP